MNGVKLKLLKQKENLNCKRTLTKWMPTEQICRLQTH
jgi:hypothetical protein